MTKTIRESINSLKQLVPFEVASRYLYIYLKKNGITCVDIFTATNSDFYIPFDSEWPKRCCNLYNNFNDLANVAVVLKAIWYKNEYMEDFVNKTNLTESYADSNFFATSNKAYFGSRLQTVMNDIHTFYKCSGPKKNCTEEELALK